MWIITLFKGQRIQMFEYDTKKEAMFNFSKISGCKVLTQVIYYNDPVINYK